MQDLVRNVGASLADVLVNIVSFIPSLIVAILLLVLGFVFGGVLGRAVMHLLNALKLDSVLEKLGVKEITDRAGIKLSTGKFFGFIVKWIIVIVFTMAATEKLGLRPFTVFLSGILSYVPSILAAALILVASVALAEFVHRLVDSSVRAAGMKASFAGTFAKYAIMTVGVIAALSALNIAASFMEILFTGLVAAISLALGLSFGLGGRDAAARAIDRVQNDFRSN
jgi:hypothetical protein